ncbi:hypothetical protein [Prevotella corporis]|uniref:Uncharacterized protein n=1 Tax=Prevotella corporis TaxID=28128 RepID=A0A133Q9N0_9BACT|nr:hypothetical protein [Prevotella corporis]KXA39569.1 hypothetical protein HMPREF3226_01405 [Prevotella corporis]
MIDELLSFKSSPIAKSLLSFHRRRVRALGRIDGKSAWQVCRNSEKKTDVGTLHGSFDTGIAYPLGY